MYSLNLELRRAGGNECLRGRQRQNVPYWLYPHRSGGVAAFYADPSLAAQFLGWKPSATLTSCAKSTGVGRNEILEVIYESPRGTFLAAVSIAEFLLY